MLAVNATGLTLTALYQKPDARYMIAMKVMMTKLDIDAENVIKIDPKGKYVFVVDSKEDVDSILELLDGWWDNMDSQFLVIGGSIKLIRVDED